jgi:predicted enzyme related to lactoylglutathione lyase
MITGFEGICLYVRDHDEALDFYVNKLGFEKRIDVEVAPGFRWVTISPPGTQGIEITLYRPGVQDGQEEARRLSEQIGQHPRWAFITDDCRGTYEELRARGVRFLSPPTDMSYALEALLEDPYGNVLVLHERRASPAQ